MVLRLGWNRSVKRHRKGSAGMACSEAGRSKGGEVHGACCLIITAGVGGYQRRLTQHEQSRGWDEARGVSMCRVQAV